MSDLIDRQAAIDVLDRNHILGQGLLNDTLDHIADAIMALPSAQPDSKETSPTHKALDTISRQDAIRIVDGIDTWQAGWRGDAIESMKALPSAQPEPCGDVVSRNAIVQKLNEMDRYVSTELRLCDTDKKFPQNEVFIVDDVYKEIVEQLPSAQPEIVQCEDCQHWEQETINDGYCTEMDLRMCDADFYCGYAERRTDDC